MTRTIQPNVNASAWCSGRWGYRRARVEDCHFTLAAEALYTQLISEVPELSPGLGGLVAVSGWQLQWEVRANAVWRFGRVFLRCPVCSQRATRLYMPTPGARFACRRCWGLSYASRQNSYKLTGWSAVLGTMGASQSHLARESRKIASAERQEARRAILRQRCSGSQAPPPESAGSRRCCYEPEDAFTAKPSDRANS